MDAKETPKSTTAISSGNSELDSRMGGGIPRGSLVLIEGGSGTGKSVLSQQIVYGALQDKRLVSIFTSENTVTSLLSQMESIALSVMDFLLLGKLKAFPMELSHLGTRAPAALLAAVKQQHRRDLVVIDSFTSALANAATDEQILSFFEGCKRLCGQGTTIMVTLHAQSVEEELLQPLRSMCDAHLRLRAEQDGQRMVKTLEVTKIRGASSTTGAIVGFEVEPGWGMRVIPISKARG